MRFLNGLDKDLRDSVLGQLRDLWTHTSTSIEGNALTLAETTFVIREGLTIAGKPLKDHEEVVGHARAIDLVYNMVKRVDSTTADDLFELHKAVQTQVVIDIYSPVGAWKKEPNGTYTADADNKPVFIEYAPPDDVPELMNEWLKELDHRCDESAGRAEALEAYVDLHAAFVRIHPFFDGNGRMARLVSNIPILKAGYPPIIIPTEKRPDYLRLLGAYELAVGPPDVDSPLLPDREKLDSFRELCKQAWNESLAIVGKARELQKKRQNELSRGKSLTK